MGPVRREEEHVEVIDHTNNNNSTTNGVHPLKNGLKNCNGYIPWVQSQPPKILPSILHHIGHTPMVRLNRIPKEEGIECEICKQKSLTKVINMLYQSWAI